MRFHSHCDQHKHSGYTLLHLDKTQLQYYIQCIILILHHRQYPLPRILDNRGPTTNALIRNRRLGGSAYQKEQEKEKKMKLALSN